MRELRKQLLKMVRMVRINEDDHMNDVYSTVEVQCSQNK